MHFRGARDGAVAKALASHLCAPSSNPGVDAICGLSLLLVLSFAARDFSPATPVFPSPHDQKSTFANSNSIRNRVDEDVLPPNYYYYYNLLLLLLLLLLSSSLSLLFHDCEKVEKMFWFCDLFMIKVNYFKAVRRDAKIEVSERGTNINCQLKVYESGTFCL